MRKTIILCVLLLLSGVAYGQSAIPCVTKYTNHPLTQHQEDAVVDFTFNTGCGNYRKSQLLKDINHGEMSKAANDFLVSNLKDHKGHLLVGLVHRRQQERTLFLRP